MIARGQVARRPSWKAVALTWVTVVCTGLTARAGDGEFSYPAPAMTECSCGKTHAHHHRHQGPGLGTLGYGPPGLFPGFQGFGLGYHLGYGYGGSALGVGAEGGYPLYGGPGYPHPWPVLNRHLATEPFFYYGGPGYPTPDQPNYFGGTGPLVSDQPVVQVGEPAYEPGYGGFSGGPPNAEAVFAPFATEVGEGARLRRHAPGTPNAPAAPASPATPPREPEASAPATHPKLGIDTELFNDGSGRRGLKVASVAAGTPAEKAGLRPGDLIQSVNGYHTTTAGNLPWIVDNAAPDKVLTMNVYTTSDGKERTLKAELR